MDPATSVRRLVPVSDLVDFITPVRDVRRRAHGRRACRCGGVELTIDGMVDRPIALDYEELLRLPSQDVTAVLECFGNPLEPDRPTRRAGNITWRGASLARILVGAGVNPEATMVWLEGLDSGTFGDVCVDRYVKDVPLARALQPDVLIAYAMNGEPLTHEHGFPARAFVPGYFGTNSVKWLSRITLVATRYEGLFTTLLYNRTCGSARARTLEPARELDVQSVIVQPSDGAPRTRQALHHRVGLERLAGYARRGHRERRRDVAGGHARRSRLRAGLAPFRDRLAGHAGSHEIRCRARDQRGRMQPDEGRNSVHAIAVSVG